METQNNERIQELISSNYRLLTIEKLTVSYKNNAKALKTCLKLVKLEIKGLKKTASSYEQREVLHKYNELAEIIKRLSRTSPQGAVNKAVDDLRLLIEKTQETLSELNGQLNPISENVRKISATLGSAANKLSEKLESGAQMLGEKVGEAVEEFKKKFNENN